MERSQRRYEQKGNWLERTVVRRGCSVGAGVTVCPGVELGRFSMIAAGSVVTKDVRPYSLMMGSPARYIGDVCSCGQRLAGSHLETDCPACGETAAMRMAGQDKTTCHA